MKVLHVFPQFTPESINGSERYEYMLASKLIELAVEVDLMTTTTRDLLPLDAFSLGWPHQYTERETEAGGIHVRRFPASRLLPMRLSKLISLQMLKRWKREERHYGLMVKGSRNLIDYYHRRAVDRPLAYELITLVRGPYSARLLTNLIRNIRRYDAIQVGFTPFAITWQVVSLARLFRKPVVVLAFFHPDDISHHFRSIYWSFSAADAVLAQTSYSAALLKRMLPRSAPVDLGAGVDLDGFADSKACGARF
jgi:glycosyltransferase involved in cell wall biosynthesis